MKHPPVTNRIFARFAKNKVSLLGGLFVLIGIAVLLRTPSETLSLTEGPKVWTRSAERPKERKIRSVEQTTKSLRFERTQVTNLPQLADLISQGDLPKLSEQEIESYLQSRNRNSESLVTAYHFSRDEAYLVEAMEKFPNDPQVMFTSLRLANDPSSRLAILESFKKVDPGNGIGHCLAARALFDLGKDDEALAELLQSSGKPIEDFSMASVQMAEEAYVSAGFSQIEAKMLSIHSLTKPELIQLASGLVQKLKEQRGSLVASGDLEMAESLREIQGELGRNLQQSGLFADNIVGILHERAALEDRDSPQASAQLEEIKNRHDALLDGARRYGVSCKIPMSLKTTGSSTSTRSDRSAKNQLTSGCWKRIRIPEFPTARAETWKSPASAFQGTLASPPCPLHSCNKATWHSLLDRAAPSGRRSPR
jgi:hypothetical protein